PGDASSPSSGAGRPTGTRSTSPTGRPRTSPSRGCSTGGTSAGRPSVSRSPVSFAVLTSGCRVNQADSLVLESEMVSKGLTAAPVERADLVVVNTCSVTASADQGARQTIRRLSRLNPDVRIVVTGCYATRRPDEVASLPNVVSVIGNDGKDGLVAR